MQAKFKYLRTHSRIGSMKMSSLHPCVWPLTCNKHLLQNHRYQTATPPHASNRWPRPANTLSCRYITVMVATIRASSLPTRSTKGLLMPRARTEEPLRPRDAPTYWGKPAHSTQNYLHNSMEKIGPSQLAFPCAPHSRDAVRIIVLLHEQRAYAVQYLQ